ncbi:tyrosine-type recombinase/integrase [Desertimonas flava]|uniref:tyrosine-type recombinase/integrase n=1 Tax=Desertimonas flava TaxID=2064846 RepID=UPI000E35254D|nr:site-specific integrase [Desertimonas flava]
MASIQQRTNGRWAVRWRDLEGRQRWRTFPTKAEAETFATTMTGATSSTTTTAPVGFSTYVAAWKRRQLWKPGTTAGVESRLRRHILPVFSDMPIDEIARADVQQFVVDLTAVYEPSTVRTTVAFLAAIFSEAQRDGLIAHSPATRIRLPRLVRRAEAIPSVAQVREMRAAMPARMQILIDLAAGSGVRLGEALAVGMDRIDTERLTLTVDRQVVPGGAVRAPKTHTSIRSIPIPAWLVCRMQSHVEEFGRESPLVVDSRTVVHQALQTSARAAGLPPRTGLHALRHFYASLLIRSGLSVKVVQARLGHATAAETLDTYGHLWPDDGDRTRAALDFLGLPATMGQL